MGRDAGRGFSLIEAIIVLMIASMVLASTLQISRGAAARNARLAGQVSASANAHLHQEMFRTLLAAARPRLQQRGEPPPKHAGEGGPSTLVLWTTLERPAACASTHPYAEVRLSIVAREGGGGQLLCQGDLGDYPLLTWPSGQGRLAYSLDGQDWSDTYPLTAEESFFDAANNLGARPDPADLLREGALIEIIPAPLVRVSVLHSGDETVWMARLGRTRKAPSPRSEFFGEAGRASYLETTP